METSSDKMHIILYRLKSVQRRATRMIPEMQTRCYEDRLPLETRRIRGDQIEVFISMKVWIKTCFLD